MPTSPLENKLIANNDIVSIPSIFDLSTESDRKKVGHLFDTGSIRRVVDDFEEQVRELFAIRNPSDVYRPDFFEKVNRHIEERKTAMPLWQQGKWVFFPWLSTLTHILDDEDFQRVRTARNRNLIREEEQAAFYNAVVGIGGLSVGSSVALSVVLQGGAKHIRLADFDRLALSNINRIRSGVQDLGSRKVEMTARQIYELNPYAIVEIFPNGLARENLDRFVGGPPKLDVIVDELDDVSIKYLIREKAKQYRVPVVMGADNGDNSVLDIERYDLDPSLQFFHGRLGDVSYDELKSLDKFGIGRTITKHIGPENITARMQESLLAMGKTIVSWPQLGGAAWINGAAVAYCIRKIVTGQPLEDNRAIISVDEKLLPDYHSDAAREKRENTAESFRKMFGL